MVSWGDGRALLLRETGSAPGGPALWPDDRLGVAHLALGDRTTPEDADWQPWQADPDVNVQVVATDPEDR